MSMEIRNNYHNIEKEMQTKAVKNEMEKINTYENRQEYSKYLNNKYACLTPTKDTFISINSNLLSKAASNPKTATWLENTLSQMPDCINKICENSARSGAKLISLEISIDNEDCITTNCVGIFEADPGTEKSKEMLEEARTRNKERKEEYKKLLTKNKEKKAEQKTMKNKKYDITVTGKEMEKIENYLINKISMCSNTIFTTSTRIGFDIKA